MAATDQELCRSGKKVKTGKSSLAVGKNREVSGNENHPGCVCFDSCAKFF
jgi:hypothetical protein